MAKTFPHIILKDDRTGKTYAMQIEDERVRDYALTKIRERMDYDYIESLPAKERAEKKKISLDFNCPFCKSKSKVSLRKEKVVTGFFIFISTRIVDIYKCQDCDKEFMKDELDSLKRDINSQNIIIENFENWKDAKRDGKNPPEFGSIDRIDEVIISSF